jgi:hypothetical protein
MPERDSPAHHFVLEAIDPQTECVAMEAEFQATELSEVLDLLETDAADVVVEGADCDLEPQEVGNLKARFHLAFEPGDFAVRLRPASRLDDLPYQIHTGRELALMLEGSKPLAVFSGAYPPNREREEIPERLFEPYVDAGRFLKRERIFQPDPAGKSAGKLTSATRTVLYALPEHACEPPRVRRRLG